MSNFVRSCLFEAYIVRVSRTKVFSNASQQSNLRRNVRGSTGTHEQLNEIPGYFVYAQNAIN